MSISQQTILICGLFIHPYSHQLIWHIPFNIFLMTRFTLSEKKLATGVLPIVGYFLMKFNLLKQQSILVSIVDIGCMHGLFIFPGNPPACSTWVGQCALYILVMILEKILMTLLIQFDFWKQVTSFFHP